MDINLFDFYLPEELIAQTPAAKRDESRLLAVNLKDKKYEDKHFFDIINYLNPGDVLVRNNTKVIPARLLGIKEKTGAHCELLLLKQIEGYIKKMKEQGKLPYEPEMTVEFLDDEMLGTGATGVEHRKYSDFTGILRDEEHIYITLDALRAVNLPLRCLDGKENELLEFLEGKLRQHGVQTDARS